MAILLNSLRLFSISLISAIVPMTAVAQSGTLPSATRTVFKCVVDGKATYSDAPCLGAQRIEITPTRGMNKSTGKELAGADVLRERYSEIMGVAIRPITGLNQKERDAQIKRFYLSPSAKIECAALDRRILDSEAAVETRAATGPQLDMVTIVPMLNARSITVPVMLIHGEYDDVADLQGLLPLFQALPNPDKRYVVVPEAGHMMMF